MFPRHGCFLGFACGVINLCFIPCKTETQKPFFLIAVTCQIHERVCDDQRCCHTKCCSWTCSGHLSAKCLSVNQPNVSLLLDKDTCITQIFIRSGRAWTAVSLLVVNICPAVIESTAPCPRDYACYVNLQKLATNFPPLRRHSQSKIASE